MIAAFEVPAPVVLLGTIVGITYGLLAVGIVLVYRSNRIINFAHGEIGVFAAAVFGAAVTRWHVPYFVAFPLALALGGAVGAAAEVGVVRRLRNAPRLMSVVATLGVGQFLVIFGAVVNSQGQIGSNFPQPPFLPRFDVGALVVTPANTAMLFFAPLLVLGLVVFLRATRFGLAMRGAAANPDAARMAGVFAGRMSSLAWAIAGGLSAFTAILILPSRGVAGAETFGPGLLLRALVGAVLARMHSMPQALAAGIGLGVIEQVLLWNYPNAGYVEVVLFVVILVALVAGRQFTGREQERGSWAAVQAWKPVPAEYRQLWLIRHLGMITGLVALAAAAALPLFVSHSSAARLSGIVGFAIVGLSVGVIAGLAGQLSLGQFALAAVGATVSYQVSRQTGWFPLSFLYAGLAAAAVSLLIGLPALRLRGLMLTVTTLSFALVTPTWLLTQSWMLGDGKDPGRPVVGSNALDTDKEYYLFALAILVGAVVLARNVRAGGLGRLLVAVRDNEDAARSFTVRARLVKLQGFLIAGFLAGVGGAAYGHAFSRISQPTFPVGASVSVVAMTVIGGVSILAGPIIGALLVIGFPAFVPLDSAGLAATQLGQLLIILYLPSGIAQILQPARDRLVAALGRRAGIAPSTDPPRLTTTSVIPRAPAGSSRNGSSPDRAVAPGPVLLSAEDLRCSFGGVHAVAGVSLRVRAGETVGLIGPNGAGKTTLFELLSGFTAADGGHVVFDGIDITRVGPEARAGLGLIRSFQDAGLFPTMTVEEVVALSLERVAPTRFVRSVVGLHRSDRAKAVQARELVDRMGLGAYRSKAIQELSTGTRRITELACLIALEPKLLLLDEPSSGIAQRETEALGDLLRDLRAELDLTLVIIEHDIPLVMGLADRVVVMESGVVIAEGPPAAVKRDPRVVEAYLGGSLAAIERSAAHSSGQQTVT